MRSRLLWPRAMRRRRGADRSFCQRDDEHKRRPLPPLPHVAASLASLRVREWMERRRVRHSRVRRRLLRTRLLHLGQVRV